MEAQRKTAAQLATTFDGAWVGRSHRPCHKCRARKKAVFCKCDCAFFTYMRRHGYSSVPDVYCKHCGHRRGDVHARTCRVRMGYKYEWKDSPGR